MNIKDIVLVAIFAALTAVGAFIKIPLPIVPFTLQFFFCAMAGILLGSKLGALSQIIYVSIGLAGLPVFTSGGGFIYVLKPTFGFLIGLVFSAYIIGFITEKAKEQNFLTSFLAILGGLFVLYLIAIPYLYFILKLYLNKPKSLTTIISLYVLPYLGGDLIKSVILIPICLKVKKIPLLKF
jgi:biotin transport system substrate-specific component